MLESLLVLFMFAGAASGIALCFAILVLREIWLDKRTRRARREQSRMVGSGVSSSAAAASPPSSPYDHEPDPSVVFDPEFERRALKTHRARLQREAKYQREETVDDVAMAAISTVPDTGLPYGVRQ